MYFKSSELQTPLDAYHEGEPLIKIILTGVLISLRQGHVMSRDLIESSRDISDNPIIHLTKAFQ